MVEQSDAFSSIYLRNPTIIHSYPTGNGQPVPLIDLYYAGAGLFFVTGYTSPFKMTGFYISGCPNAVYGIPNSGYIMADGVLQGAVGINIDTSIALAESLGATFSFTHVNFLPYGHHPPRYVLDTAGVLWDGTGEFPLGGNVPPPPPPPPPPEWTTQAGTFQMLNTTPAQFRFCTDPANEATCQLFVKP
jgi:hypothetical protein